MSLSHLWVIVQQRASRRRAFPFTPLSDCDREEVRCCMAALVRWQVATASCLIRNALSAFYAPKTSKADERRNGMLLQRTGHLEQSMFPDNPLAQFQLIFQWKTYPLTPLFDRWILYQYLYTGEGERNGLRARSVEYDNFFDVYARFSTDVRKKLRVCFLF